ncbi:sulfotransferase [Thermodesulfobacteriota bacterium]
MQDYSPIDQLFHKIVLGFPAIDELLFGIEKKLFLDKADTTNLGQSVFITGLARAGTTVLMRALYESGQFASLTYDDMPFVMAPNLWQKIASKHKKTRVKAERAHGDGVEVDFDSPEALEEVFWRTYHGNEYIEKNTLKVHSITKESDELFAAYQALVCKRYNKQRYLSKNNNHILRIRSLAQSRSKPIILVPFRNPIKQAYSLLNQHLRFLDSEPFVRQYIGWLVHHEFGATHKPFCFNKEIYSNYQTDTIEYWLERWIDAYKYLLGYLKKQPQNVIPICYERLCSEPSYWDHICSIVGIPNKQESYFSASIKRKEFPSLPDEMKETAFNVYQELCPAPNHCTSC